MNVFSRGERRFPALLAARAASCSALKAVRRGIHSAPGAPTRTAGAVSAASVRPGALTGNPVRLTEITGRLTGFSIRLTGIPVARTAFVITRPHPAGPHWKGPPSGLRTGWRPFLQLCHAGRHDTRGHAFTKLPCGVMRTRRSRSVRSSSTSKTYHSPDGVSA